jgi:hypothetical protein
VPDEVLDILMIGDREDITIGLSGRVALQTVKEIQTSLPFSLLQETIF